MNSIGKGKSGLGGLLVLLAALFLVAGSASAALSEHPGSFPPALASYRTPPEASVLEALTGRIRAEPFNLIGTLIFLLAILHTFLAPMFMKLSHHFEARHRERLAQAAAQGRSASKEEVSFKAEIFHFLGEVEAIFGIWAVPLMLALTVSKGWPVARDYLGGSLNFTEPIFVVVIMTIAASRPILQLSERMMALAARLGRGSRAAWWFSILTIGPLLGSFITEPAAMTISALLLAEHFYKYRPPSAFAYATLGLLFVNVSVGGTLTHFAAPPVLMVAGRWGWDLNYMLMHFGWKAASGIIASNLLFLVLFKRQFKLLEPDALLQDGEPAAKQKPPAPLWIIAVHICFLAWTVMNNHFPALFVGGFLFYLAFTHATEHHQGELNLRPALLVGFFLAGLVVHGGLQGWWIEPVLNRLGERPLFLAAATLTAFNDNAAITYLASLVPEFTEQLKYAVVAGAVVGGGLTVIANAPNPAGQSILSRFFANGVSPVGLFLGAVVPTIITGAIFLLLR